MNSVYLCVDIVGYDSRSGFLIAGGNEVFDFEVCRLCKIHHLVSCWRKYEVYIFKNIRRFYYIFRVGKSIILRINLLNYFGREGREHYLGIDVSNLLIHFISSIENEHRFVISEINNGYFTDGLQVG